MKMPVAGYRVYLLIDPRDMVPFYAGMTCRPAARWNGHNSDRASAAYSRLGELRRLGLKCRVRIIRMNLALGDAKALEREIIEAFKPTLLNWQTRRAETRLARAAA